MNLNKLAIVQLCYADFEALEISLAAYAKLTNPNVHIYLLQNGRDTYDTERTYRVCQRYAKLYPERISVVDWLAPDVPYRNIKRLLASDEMKQYDYICKVDDDVFPLTADWLEKLVECYEKSYKKYGERLGYVTSLVNNNPWGFKQTVEALNLMDEYKQIAVSHYAGVKGDEDSMPYVYVKKGDIYTGGGGSIWAVSHYARWIHQKTTLHPDEFIAHTKDLKYKEVDNTKRYSINCMLFKKEFWTQIDRKHIDDELQAFWYCRDNDKKIIANLSVPMVHICFFTQREESKDLLPVIRAYYQQYWKLPYPITLCPLKEYENENRLRWLENKMSVKTAAQPKNKKQYTFLEHIFSIKNSTSKKHKVLCLFGVKFKISRRKNKK